MVVAFDLRPLQSGHKYRGIGISLQNILQEILKSPDSIKNWEIIYYVYAHQPIPQVIKSQLQSGRLIKVSLPKARPSRFKLIRRINFFIGAWSRLNSVNKLPELNDVDIFLQFDFLFGLPKKSAAKKILVMYDLIPLVMPTHYLPTFSEVKMRTGSRKVALKAWLNRRRYLYSLQRSLERSDLVLAISDHTKKDLQRYLGVAPEKIKILYLAADRPSPAELTQLSSSSTFESIDWRFIDSQKRLRSLSLLDAPYILYIGGADPRRRIQDLITAFNHVRAAEVSCRLVLVGFAFQDIEKIPNDQVKKALRFSSYGADIYLLGFVDFQQKALLYKQAIAFVYPSLYEGFGIPVLEAMEYGCPVICYDNSSLREVGGKAALYTSGFEDIAETLKKLLAEPAFRNQVIKKGQTQAAQFTWQKTAVSLIKSINEISMR